MTITATTTQISLSFPNTTVLSKAMVAEFADGEWAYTSDTKTTWRLDRSATSGGVPTSSGYGRWIPFTPTPAPPSGVSMTLIYQPGGVPGGNVYADPWLLYNAIAGAGDIVDVYVDCTFTSPAPWPVDQPIPGARFHQSPKTSVPAVMATVAGTNPSTGLPTNGFLSQINLLDGILVMNAGSTAQYMVRVGGLASGATFTMLANAAIQRANDGDILALGIDTPAPVSEPFALTIDGCVNPFPNLGDTGAWNVQFNGSLGNTLNVLLLTGGPSFHLPSFSTGPGPVLNVQYDSTISQTQLNEGAWQGTVNLIPLTLVPTATGVWYVDISGKYGFAGTGTQPVGNGTPNAPFNFIQSALNAVDAAARAATAPGGFNYGGYLISITEGFSSENLSLPADSPANNVTLQGSGSQATGVAANTGPTFSWTLAATPFGGGGPPSTITFRDMNFNTQDLVSNTVQFDGSAPPANNGAFNNILFVNVSIDNAGGNPAGTGIPLFIKTAQVSFAGDQNSANVNANGTTASVQVWNGQFNVTGANVNVGLLQLCSDYRPGAPPHSGGIGVVQCGQGAQIQAIQARGTPVIFIPAGGQVGQIVSQALDPTSATAFSTNVPGAWVGAAVTGLFGPGVSNIGPVVGVEGILGPLFGPGASSLITFPDMSAFAMPAPVIGPTFFVLPGGIICGTFEIDTVDPAGVAIDWTGVKLFSNVFNGTVPSFTAGNGVTIDLSDAAYNAASLHVAGTGKFIQNQIPSTSFADTNNATASSPAYTTLLTENYTTRYGGALAIWFSASYLLDTGGLGQDITFQILVDGVPLATPSASGSGSDAVGANGRGVASLMTKTLALAPGLHTVEVQWQVSSGTATISNGGPTFERSASLMAMEVQ